MDQVDLVRMVTELLERLNVRYMLVGSMASMVYGESRYTHDIDVVVDLDLRTVVGTEKGSGPILTPGTPECPDEWPSRPGDGNRKGARSEWHCRGH